jgi:hypothetical protein
VNWAGISVAAGLVVIAVTAGPIGWLALVAGAWWLWRRG